MKDKVLRLVIKLSGKVEQFRRKEEGQAFSEYAIIIGVVAVLIIAVLILFKDALVGLFTRIINSINGVGGSAT